MENSQNIPFDKWIDLSIIKIEKKKAFHLHFQNSSGEENFQMEFYQN